MKDKHPISVTLKRISIRVSVKKSPGGGMVDALVSGASAARRAGSSPVLGTVKSRNSLKIKSCGISLLIFVPPIVPQIIS